MKYFFKPYSIFVYVVLIAIMGLIGIDDNNLDIRIDAEYYPIIDRGGLKVFAGVFGLIWLLYIWQEVHLQSRKLMWIHFAASFITLAALCWYHAQGFAGRLVHIETNRMYKGALSHHTNDIFLLPYSNILLIMFVLAQGTFIWQLAKGNMKKI